MKEEKEVSRERPNAAPTDPEGPADALIPTRPPERARAYDGDARGYRCSQGKCFRSTVSAPLAARDTSLFVERPVLYSECRARCVVATATAAVRWKPFPGRAPNLPVLLRCRESTRYRLGKRFRLGVSAVPYATRVSPAAFSIASTAVPLRL
ncbi:hypothetical protein R5R35_001171 [Gryllus longicercus]|uniref:Uncharacterized protein n=1 Tax=Gryllus longicercus TaxID=2509291 RepID=A0AAN9YXD9_9ORTH